MSSQEAYRGSDERASTEPQDASGLLVHKLRQEFPTERRRIALLTPYSGGNLGDAATQDAIIANLRLRLPNPQFSGLTLNGDNFVERHGTSAYPLYASRQPFHRLHPRKVPDPPHGGTSARPARGTGLTLPPLRKLLGRTPGLGWCLKAMRAFGERVYGELLHSIRGYRFLRTHHLLIVSGGGQLDEEWGGPWGHPFALFKWAVLARIARVPYAIASVGACKINSAACRLFLSAALRMAQYRSYRDKNSKEIAAGLLQAAVEDPVVPDMAFSLPSSELPPPAGIRSISRGRPIVAISPIAYAKPSSWAYEDAVLYERYLEEMAHVASQLLERDYFLVIVCSSVGDDDRVVPEILGRLDDESKQRAARQIHVPGIRTWQDLVACLREVDFLIASRLHSAILCFVAQKPTVAISFDPKVDWVMEDLGQTDFLLHIRDFRAEDVIEALHRIEPRRRVVAEQIASYLERILSVSKLQCDTLADLAEAGQPCRA